ncbi:MAG: hypothetical protein HKP59_09405 [Lutibacter sp.]|uniref:WD40/YVTN/BNR-like repeat-containing protein n=1 Tax=Lutibacter sp. TaxID=1925666 RepID=UPI001819F019|nr:hypothetical protein [Lutibacter sp.]MBT8317834.1 hypothetical protein [Lutibacter sp.]NNJ58692.1 hypothetical protein [Lutibacter sp.]
MKIHIFSVYLLFTLFFSSVLVAQDFKALKYRTVGPARGGRVTTVTGTPLLPGTFYLGASGGGVWKSNDYGISWENVSDGYFKTPSIGAIQVAVNDPNIVYVGTGSDGLRSNVISGKGMYKSIDAGKTWEHIGLHNVGQIGAVEIDPTNHNIVWVAAIGNAFKANSERGIYKTIDGGENWEKVLFISNEVGFSDLELLPGNPTIIYAAAWKAKRTPWTIISGGTNEEGGIYKSVNGGETWEKLNKGLPQDLIGKIDLAVSQTNSSIVYAIIEAPGKEGGLYKSENQGKSFEQVSSEKGLINRPFYYVNVEVDPNNSDIVYSMANPMLKSINGGKTWIKVHPPHGDNHDIWINPNNSDLFIQANDGGANVTHNGGKSWSTQFNQPTAELYQVEVDDQYPYWLYAGQQDNYTTIAVPSFAPSAIQNTGVGWIINTGGCETGPAVPKPGNHNIVYVNCKGRFGVFNKLTGVEKEYSVGATNIYGHNPKDLKYRFQRVAPIHVSPHNSDVVYHGSQFLHKTKNDGLIWETISSDLTAFEADKQVISGSPITRDITGEEYYSTLYSIRESKLQEGLIWTGSNDGVVSVTKDGGKTWANVTPKKMPKGGRVESIEPSHFNPAKAYVVVDRHLLGDTKPYIYKTNDYGKTWQLMSTATNGIPLDYTSRVLREDPIRSGLLYVGTEYGLFISFDDGNSWKSFQQNLPVTPVTDIKIFRGDLILSTMGRSFWILDNITTLRQSQINILDTTPWLFKPDNTIRYRYPKIRNSETTFPIYKQPSVTIDYYIPKGNKNRIKLDILNASNKIVASYVSDSIKQKLPDKILEDMNTNEVLYLVNKTLSTNYGLNRFEWDMRHIGPWQKEINRRYKNGPIAAPGVYTVKLTIDNEVLEQNFELLIDPRTVESGVSKEDITSQVDMQHKISNLVTESQKLVVFLENELKSLKESNNQQDRIKKIEGAFKLLKTVDEVYPQPKLNDQILYLYRMNDKADQLPGMEVEKRFEELSIKFNEIKKILE